MNLAGWLHPHFALTCPEAIERLVIERDNFFRRQGLAILGGVSIAGQQHVVALSHSPADGCIDTILCLAPGDDQAFDAARLQLRLQTRLMICLWYKARPAASCQAMKMVITTIISGKMNCMSCVSCSVAS